LQKLGADIVANVFLIELSDLGGRKVLEEFAPTISLLQY
jgi:adenine/guanine phosphoribosyltransferase-like PRPP-binding protein